MIHRLEVERRVSEDHEKAPFEACILPRLDDLPNQARDSLELHWGRVVGHAQREFAAALSPVLEILNPAAEKIRVREHQLLPSEGPDSRSPEADVLHGPRQIPTLIESPTTNGLSKMMEREANRSPSTPWSASAKATPPIPKDATSGPMSIPTLSRASITNMAQTPKRMRRPTEPCELRLNVEETHPPQPTPV